MECENPYEWLAGPRVLLMFSKLLCSCQNSWVPAVLYDDSGPSPILFMVSLVFSLEVRCMVSNFFLRQVVEVPTVQI